MLNTEGINLRIMVEAKTSGDEEVEETPNSNLPLMLRLEDQAMANRFSLREKVIRRGYCGF